MGRRGRGGQRATVGAGAGGEDGERLERASDGSAQGRAHRVGDGVGGVEFLIGLCTKAASSPSVRVSRSRGQRNEPATDDA